MGNCQQKSTVIRYIQYQREVFTMIVYDRLWATMKAKGISQYKLLKDYRFSSGQLDRLRRNENVSTHTLAQLCAILDCRLEDIAEYVGD